MSDLPISHSNVQGQNELMKRDSQTMSPKFILGIVVVVLAVLGAGAALVLSVGCAMILAGVVVGVVALVMGVVGAALLISERVKTREHLGSSEATATEPLTQQRAGQPAATATATAPAPVTERLTQQRAGQPAVTATATVTATLHFPEKGAIVAYLEKHEQTRGLYLKQKNIIDAVADSFADQEKEPGGVDMGVQVTMMDLDLDQKLHLTPMAFTMINTNLIAALKDCAAGKAIAVE